MIMNECALRMEIRLLQKIRTAVWSEMHGAITKTTSNFTVIKNVSNALNKMHNAHCTINEIMINYTVQCHLSEELEKACFPFQNLPIRIFVS